MPALHRRVKTPKALLSALCSCPAVLLCPPPPVIAHATLSAEPGMNFSSGTSVSYSCQSGYSLLGDPSVLCTAWGNWSLPYPRCAGGAGSASTPWNAQHPSRARLSTHPMEHSASIPCQAQHLSCARLSIHPVPGSPWIRQTCQAAGLHGTGGTTRRSCAHFGGTGSQLVALLKFPKRRQVWVF